MIKYILTFQSKFKIAAPVFTQHREPLQNRHIRRKVSGVPDECHRRRHGTISEALGISAVSQLH